MSKQDIPKSLMDRVRKTKDGCWILNVKPNSHGYARVFWKKKGHYAHRLFYEMSTGPIQEGLSLDHICRKTECVNPDHLEAITHRTNCLRGISPAAIHARQTHCKHGHPFTKENTYQNWVPTKGRVCKKCHRNNSKQYRRRFDTIIVLVKKGERELIKTVAKSEDVSMQKWIRETLIEKAIRS